MESSAQLAHRFREVMLDGKWIAQTNFQKALAGLSWEQANQEIASLNTIAALTFHVDYYIAGILQFFEGGELEIRDKYSFDFTPPANQEEWDQMVETMRKNAEIFASRVEKMSETQLEQPFVKAEYGNYRRNIEGMIEHAYYHLGQVSLIRKLLENS